MSSETITRNDLANILNEVGTGVPYEDTGAIQLVTGIKYRRKNGIVFVDCYVGNGTSLTTSYQTLGTLPEGYRPLETQYAPMGVNTANVGVAYVSGAGVIGAKTFSGTATYYWFHFAYPVAQNALFDEKVDYIVEQGTSGIWAYRKWNSGVSECWGTKDWTVSSWTQWGSSGNVYYSNYSGTTAYPTNLFTATPTLTVRVGLTSGDCWQGTTSANSTTQAPQLYALRVGVGSTSITAHGDMYAIGTWK